MQPPNVRFSLRWKIAIPFMLLAMALGFGVVALIGRSLSGSAQERLARQLAGSGRQAVDSVVLLESDLLRLERLVANTDGVVEGVSQADAEALRSIVLPLAVNVDSDFVSIVNREGTSLLTARRPPDAPVGEYETLRGESFYAGWAPLQEALAGGSSEGESDKRTSLELIVVGDQWVPVLVIAGPLRDAGSRVVGAVLVGEFLGDIIDRLGETADADVSVYDRAGGALLDTSLSPQDPAALTLSEADLQAGLALDAETTPLRKLVVNGLPYQEALTALVAGPSGEALGVLGVSLPELAVMGSADRAVREIALFAAFGMALTVLIGLLVINYVTRPLIRAAAASSELSAGNLDVEIPEQGADEVAMLARSFNTMAQAIRTAGYTVIRPAVTQARQADTLPLELPQPASPTVVTQSRATVLAAELTGYPLESAQVSGEIAMANLAELYVSMERIINGHGGQVEAFEGRELRVTFGIRPRRLPTAVAALQAVHAGLALQELVEGWQKLRTPTGSQPTGISIGIATGEVVTGLVGETGRSHTAMLGSANETAGHLRQIAREIPESRVLISATTYTFLAGAQRHFLFGRTGQASVRGRDVRITLYEVLGRNLRLIEGSARQP
ncbi:MAG: HAMP domain-containing protein [Anaerolineales bacterium]|nr:HAMP domain-containing protein [Anaerolineales bacterium]